MTRGLEICPSVHDTFDGGLGVRIDSLDSLVYMPYAELKIRRIIAVIILYEDKC